jgi:hypothetical protein
VANGWKLTRKELSRWFSGDSGEVALGDMLRSTERTLAHQLAQEQFELRAEIDEAVPEVRGDATRWTKRCRFGE